MHTISFRPERGDDRRDAAVRAALAAADPARTAHVVVDLQNGFMAPGAPVEVPEAREIVDNVNRISVAVRAAGGTNVFLRMSLGTPAVERWTDFLDHHPVPEDRDALVAAFTEGADSFELWPGLDVADGDLIVDKSRYSAFVPGASRLHDELQARGIDTVVVTGTLTNVCCESTARDAMQMDYRILFVADATAALSDETHNATLANIDARFGRVVRTDELLARLRAYRCDGRSRRQ